jgi:hypothetical protein
MRKFKVIFIAGNDVFEEEVEAESFTCPDGAVKFYYDERMVAIYKNMLSVVQVDGPKERTEKEKQDDVSWENGKKKKKDNKEESDPFANFK